jgi:4a-hydroxytetrahydrobiopterin dehydratase
MSTLSQEEIENRLPAGWQRQGSSLLRELTLSDFAAAVEFVNRVAQLAESANHHPDIHLHGWNKVRLELSTHSEGAITESDLSLARQINEVI